MKFNTLDRFFFTLDVWEPIAHDPATGNVTAYGFKETISARVYLDGSGSVKVHTPSIVPNGSQFRNIRDRNGVILFPDAGVNDGQHFGVLGSESVMNPFGTVEARRYVGVKTLG